MRGARNSERYLTTSKASAETFPPDQTSDENILRTQFIFHKDQLAYSAFEVLSWHFLVAHAVLYSCPGVFHRVVSIDRAGKNTPTAFSTISHSCYSSSSFPVSCCYLASFDTSNLPRQARLTLRSLCRLLGPVLLRTGLAVVHDLAQYFGVSHRAIGGGVH
jgi:hypothetical protein